ncbi:elongation factor P maturation arginine rhamnosyltransferase EarP [Sulfurirhabdus autotrophica]|uniref:Protein-arginine rhamnosyltransferase n=1 Tax=Sulfurirhabdus autotrophica TaxID=1706046 RepID=A0A4R3XVS4_9PROT|nr:elongation factor P maturation arginine rhamnosyltransferase EarP [Sulfurirhabdus autotrophica]TCV83376.1 putative repeat protein (TIGR03837 family) [Sulfurirhabdus autotrophica]
MSSGKSWDIFCNVIDNYGDIGVCWRLARQLSLEHQLQVRLWVDDLGSLAKICPGIDPFADIQFFKGIEVCHWVVSFPDVNPANVVIEAFACKLPESYIQNMAGLETKPVWINLEYLSAEDWVAGCHGLPSQHPRLPLVKYFFFPGFNAKTGGVLLEQGLISRRNQFQQDSLAQSRFWESLDVSPRCTDEIRVSLFGYENSALASLFDTWANGSQSVFCLVPEGKILSDVTRYFGLNALQTGAAKKSGNLTVQVLPFVEQARYDELLWACDCNFVRGEDSFVRAQWAAKPFVWHIYPQDENAHMKKLMAFLSVYSKNLPQETATDLRRFWEAWNRAAGAGDLWHAFWQHKALFEAHAGQWANCLAENGDLALNLVQFCKSKL